MSDEKVECQYCGKKYSKRGVANHEKYCDENPENKEQEVTIIPKRNTVLTVKGEFVKLRAHKEMKIKKSIAEALKRINLC